MADFVSLLPIFTCIMVFQWGFFGGGGGGFLFLFCFKFFFAIPNHAALKAVTGLTLKEDIGRISFRPGHQLTCIPNRSCHEVKTTDYKNTTGKKKNKPKTTDCSIYEF